MENLTDQTRDILIKNNYELNDALYIDEIISHTEGKGYMNVIMCVAAKISYDVLNKKLFTLSPGQLFDTSNVQTLTEKIYPSFGFEQAHLGGLGSMYAKIEDVLKLQKCRSPVLKQ